MLQNTKSKGFTLVELLIVIVVIAILAAISIVAYNGIQNRGKASSAASAASTIQKKAEAANAITSSYPTTAAGFSAQEDSSLAGSGITLDAISAAPTDPNTVEYAPCADGTGADVSYWDYSKTASQKTTKHIGAACTAGTPLTGTY